MANQISTAEKAAIEAEAKMDAQGFVEEFGEAFDPDESDWDATAWQQSPSRHTGDAGFAIYQAALVSETKRLADLPETTECIYCHHDVNAPEAPKASDDEAWADIAKQHAPTCEWIETRAHSRDAA